MRKSFSINEILLETIRFTRDFGGMANTVFERMGVVQDVEFETINLVTHKHSTWAPNNILELTFFSFNSLMTADISASSRNLSQPAR